MAKKYIGITIGPIFDTINLSSSPITLWASSFMFSYLSKSICDALVEDFGLSEKSIVAPFYEKNSTVLSLNNGVGLFHDRIIFSSESFSGDMKEVRKNAIERVCNTFGFTDKDREYLDEYIMIASATFEASEGENPILKSGKILDALELSKPFVFKESYNPILSAFSKNNDCSNSSLKKLIYSFEDFQLINGDKKFKSLGDISGEYNGFKRRNYFAILRSDGDGMSDILSTLKSDGEIREYSESCLDFCSKSSALVKAFGGVTIYSGGDDLLALLPCESNGNTVFDLISDLNSEFSKHFSKYSSKASLSFGVTMTYHKFPLYEALEESANLLFDVAKKTKNCTAVLLQKHSGQSEGLVISNNALNKWRELISLERDDETLLSSMHKLSLFKGAFEITGEDSTNIFKNTFDSQSHEDNDFLHEELPELFNALKSGETDICSLSEGHTREYDAVITLHNILRILKFFVEKGGEKK